MDIVINLRSFCERRSIIIDFEMGGRKTTGNNSSKTLGKLILEMTLTNSDDDNYHDGDKSGYKGSRNLSRCH